MLENNQIKKIKELRKKGFSYKAIADKMNISTKTAIKYGKEEETQEEHDDPEAENPIAEDSIVEEHVQEMTTPSMTYQQYFKFIEAITICEKAIEYLQNKDYSTYNMTAKILASKYEYTLNLLKNHHNEGLEALAELNKELDKFDAEYNTADNLKGDITRLRREKIKNIMKIKALEKESKTQEKKINDMVIERQRRLKAYDSEITEKQTELKKLKNEIISLEEEKATGKIAVVNIVEKGVREANYWYEQINNLKQCYNITLDFREMVEIKSRLENTIAQLTSQLTDMNDTISLQENREILRKPLENLVEVVDVMPLDLFLKLCETVEKRKATDPYFMQEDIIHRMISNQPYTYEEMSQMIMTQIARAMNSGDELDKIIKFKKLEQMMQ
jgi:transcriptional regulator with XRE-family HTH domain